MTSYLKLAIAFFALFILQNANGYGPIGHEIIGAIADEKLAHTPAGAKVVALLDGITLEKASTIPDEIRGWDKNGPDDPAAFHYSAHPKINEQLRAFCRANDPFPFVACHGLAKTRNYADAGPRLKQGGKKIAPGFLPARSNPN